MDIPEPTEQHRLLEKLIGRWAGEERIHPSPFEPEGGKARGVVQNRALGGFCVIQDYEQERCGETAFIGHGVFGYDTEAGHYTLHWFDSWGMPYRYTGDYRDGVFTFLTQGGLGHFRASFDLREADTYIFRMEVSGDGRQWSPFMEGTYRRQ